MTIDNPQDEMIADVQRSVIRSRQIYYRQMTDKNQITDDLHRELAVSVMQYADVLPLDQAQDRVDSIGELRDAIGSEQRVEVEAAGDTSNTETKLRPAVLSFAPDELVSISKQLDSVASDLGFGPDADAQQDRGPMR